MLVMLRGLKRIIYFHIIHQKQLTVFSSAFLFILFIHHFNFPHVFQRFGKQYYSILILLVTCPIGDQYNSPRRLQPKQTHWNCTCHLSFEEIRPLIIINYSSTTFTLNDPQYSCIYHFPQCNRMYEFAIFCNQMEDLYTSHTIYSEYFQDPPIDPHIKSFQFPCQ